MNTGMIVFFVFASLSAFAAESEPSREGLLAELHVVGNHLENSAGATVWLQGLSVDSLQWSAKGERTVQSIQVAIDGWKANVIRLAVVDDFWFGRGGDEAEGQ